MRLSRSSLPFAFSSCALLVTTVGAQNGPPRLLVFSAPVTAEQCREFPADDFEIGPSLTRWNSKDLLHVRCKLLSGDSFTLTLTFSIDIDGPSGSRGVLGEVFSFRWGKSVNGPSSAFGGQFTHDPGLCSGLIELLKSKDLKWVPAASTRVRQPPELSSSCNPDDLWGTSMEIIVTGDFSDSSIEGNSQPETHRRLPNPRL